MVYVQDRGGGKQEDERVRTVDLGLWGWGLGVGGRIPASMPRTITLRGESRKILRV